MSWSSTMRASKPARTRPQVFCTGGFRSEMIGQEISVMLKVVKMSTPKRAVKLAASSLSGTITT